MNLDVPLGVHRVHIGPEPFPCALDRDLRNRHTVVCHLGNGPSGKMDVDRCQNRAATEGRRRATAAQQRLVDVVVENGAKARAIFAAQRP
jgi:hypothetical protein